MTKQETIKQHYISEFINSGMSQQEAEQKWEHIEEFINTDDGYFQNREEYYRPISLHGIETNNSWIKLPTKEFLSYGHYWIRVEHPETKVVDEFIFELNKGCGIIPYTYATHYQPITKPLPPLH